MRQKNPLRRQQSAQKKDRVLPNRIKKTACYRTVGTKKKRERRKMYFDRL